MSLETRTVLIIDDDPDILSSTSSILKKRGMETLEAQTAEDGLVILKNHHPDLILTDVLLPQMNGFELVKQIRQNPFTADIPILVITGRGHMKESFDILGVEGFVPKPFTPDDLVQRVQNILEIHTIRGAESQTQRKRIVLTVGRVMFQSVLEEIVQTVNQIGCEGLYTTSASGALAKVVDIGPSLLLVDVLLEGKSSSELVNMVRHLPGYEEIMIAGFSYYRVDQLSDADSRKKILAIESNAQLFLKSGANHYLGRYTQQGLISFFKTEFLKKNERNS